MLHFFRVFVSTLLLNVTFVFVISECAGEMMMGVFWYYRHHQNEGENLSKYLNNEVFASRHRDVIPVACIEDRCYVLTLNEFCRSSVLCQPMSAQYTIPSVFWEDFKPFIYFDVVSKWGCSLSSCVVDYCYWASKCSHQLWDLIQLLWTF